MTSGPAAATSNIDFQLQTLGWKSFQELCLLILRNQLGQSVQEFSAVHDGGRDGAFSGEWKPGKGLELSGQTVVQCKFTAKADASLTLSQFENEIRKIQRLWESRGYENYVLLTNHAVSGRFEEIVRQRCNNFGCRNFHVFGKEWINAAIRSSSRLRLLVPRFYGLGDLSQILDERAYKQTELLLKEETDNLRKFVPTHSYRFAANALNTHGFVMLLGAPAVGKSAIAATLALAAADAWQCRPIRVEHPRELRDHWNPYDPKQFFWVDDAFGQLQYDQTRSRDWNAGLPWLQTIIGGGAKVILTSRNYIYARARSDLKQSAFPLLKETEVVVDVEHLTVDERRRILYSHVRLGSQPRVWRAKFKQCFEDVATHPQFMPEIARRLGNSSYTKNLEIPREVRAFVAEPEEFLRETIEGLSTDDKAALAAIFLRGGTLRSPVSLLPEEIGFLARIGSSANAIPTSLKALRESFVRYSLTTESWEFKHPTIGDALASILADDPELVDIYVSGVPMNRLLAEVVCGVDTIRGAKLAVPTSRYALVASRLIEFVEMRELSELDLSGSSTATTSDQVLTNGREFSDKNERIRRRRERLCASFLAERCSKRFLELFMHRAPDFWTTFASIRTSLSVASHFALLAKLRDLNLLPDNELDRILKDITWLAVHKPDADFLLVKSVKRFFSKREIRAILDAVRRELIPNLGAAIALWELNRSNAVEPRSYYYPILEALAAYARVFYSDLEIRHSLRMSISTIDGIVNNFAVPFVDRHSNELRSFLAAEPSVTDPVDLRPIYDDLDL